MLPDEQAAILIEVFEVLRRLRLNYQLRQRRAGQAPTDLLSRDQLTPIERSVVSQALREIAAVQRRMDNIGAYVAIDEWGPARP
jgi:CBS domain-containing protein